MCDRDIKVLYGDKVTLSGAFQSSASFSVAEEEKKREEFRLKEMDGTHIPWKGQFKSWKSELGFMLTEGFQRDVSFWASFVFSNKIVPYSIEE